eukprot:TRINITY_DN2126_c0_g1_i1.p1 TRINITY_DN2126_c0_g1~~TRINITY_DN2126_c0_g1_i1.p1  ORF type:complete len:106 (-),score=5.09 TRINITY_DN2126_c0_g1_i1:130-447(-)
MTGYSNVCILTLSVFLSIGWHSSDCHDPRCRGALKQANCSTRKTNALAAYLSSCLGRPPPLPFFLRTGPCSCEGVQLAERPTDVRPSLLNQFPVWTCLHIVVLLC